MWEESFHPSSSSFPSTLSGQQVRKSICCSESCKVAELWKVHPFELSEQSKGDQHRAFTAEYSRGSLEDVGRIQMIGRQGRVGG